MACCDGTMCANAGNVLNCVFNDLTTIIKPLTPAINSAIVGKPNTVAGSLGNFSSSQILMFGVIAAILFVVLDGRMGQ